MMTEMNHKNYVFITKPWVEISFSFHHTISSSVIGLELLVLFLVGLECT